MKKQLQKCTNQLQASLQAAKGSLDQDLAPKISLLFPSLTKLISACAVRPEGGGLAAIGHQPGTAPATQRVDQATGGVVRQRVLVGKAQTPMAQGDAGLTCGVKAD